MDTSPVHSVTPVGRPAGMISLMVAFDERLSCLCAVLMSTPAFVALVVLYCHLYL